MTEIVNPDSIGDPSQTPIVKLDEDMVVALKRAGLVCDCGGMNGWHGRRCPQLPPGSDRWFEDEDEANS